MKTDKRLFFSVLFIVLSFPFLSAQYGYGNGYGYGYGGYGGYGRQRNSIPQVQETPKEPEKLTAEQIVDQEMPGITEKLGLNPFEEAVLSTTLKKYLQERIELQILDLPPDKMRESYEKITQKQDEELMAGLPADKYEAFVELQKNGFKKVKEKKKKKKKNKSKT
ncbi:hypothetical protein QSE00_23165 [Arenibacter sp. M-2]|uniref:hypothetical protein n=1 Tax=unclassified Arenibacter TaxID=2615047 RepID=UPI000D7534EC|nr:MULTISPECIES: hypothetical protein [unclassified Arenibacter]MDL5514730.1 hypothetical protein [Arenibacter sp. M-2]PXX25004.1 hypothetical protein C7972_114101 [Arenibacter sp. ARW7G5Y1]|tara:strand:- start:10526 stop:11020 length:495 start_codon:yes stop_codon:yes gene_type:complete